MPPTTIPIKINDQDHQVPPGQTILEACRSLAIDIPVLCHLDGLSDVGACRMCLVEVEGAGKLLPACTTRVMPQYNIKTHTEKLRRYRRMTLELFFSERNHVCSVCVANTRCELQDLALQLGMDHVRFPYLFPSCQIDASHPEYVMDHNRCIMCTRCVRVCSEVEGAYHWDVMNRGVQVRIISDFNRPWAESTTCTSCGKCLDACPTGALWPKSASQGQWQSNPAMIGDLVARRKVGL